MHMNCNITLVRRMLRRYQLRAMMVARFCGATSVGIVALASIGCSGLDEVLTPPIASTTLYSRLDVNHHAILLSTVAPYDTVRLHTTPRNFDGEAWRPNWMSAAAFDSLLAASPASYISQDSTKVKVSADGLVRAIAPTTGAATVRIVASRQIGNVTRADTVLVRAQNVVNPQRIRTYRHRPADTLKVAIATSLAIQLTAVDSHNVAIANVVTYVKTVDSTIVGVGPTPRKAQHNATALRGNANAGSTRIVSQAYIYGIAVADTFFVIAGARLSKLINVKVFDPILDPVGAIFYGGFSQWVIGPGGVGNWSVYADSVYSPPFPVDIIFDDPTVALAPDAVSSDSGNILNAWGNNFRRRFVIPGEHFFRVEPFGLRGSVIVAPQ